MITLTENAKNYLSSVAKDDFVTLGVNGGGCSGFQYNWDMVNDDTEGTLIDNILVLDKMAEMFVIGCTVDYIKDFGGSYLTVTNPNAKAMCGCATSFTI